MRREGGGIAYARGGAGTSTGDISDAGATSLHCRDNHPEQYARGSTPPTPAVLQRRASGWFEIMPGQDGGDKRPLIEVFGHEAS